MDKQHIEIQDSIKEKLALILGTNNFDLFNYSFDCSYSEKLEVGKYNLFLDENKIASFELHPMINCCGICVSTRAEVNEDWRNKGLGQLLNSIRIDIARAAGYSLLLCTDIDKNEAQRKILKANGWTDIHSFVNSRTKNRVYITVINL